MQTPLSHWSVCVQALPSVHAVPLGAAGLLHWPVDGLHVPAAWHWSAAVQTIGFDPVQAPFRQASVRVQALPSSQAVPFAAVGLLH